jgi:hypothetical protein
MAGAGVAATLCLRLCRYACIIFVIFIFIDLNLQLNGCSAPGSPYPARA